MYEMLFLLMRNDSTRAKFRKSLMWIDIFSVGNNQVDAE